MSRQKNSISRARLALLVFFVLISGTTFSHAQSNSQSFQNLTITGLLQVRAPNPATPQRLGVPSGILSLLGSGWEIASNQALEVGVTLQTLVTDSKLFNFVLATQRGNQASAPLVTLANDGNVTLAGNLTVNGLGSSRFVGDLAIGTSRDPAILSVTGALTVSDIIRAKSFQGSGAELTDLSASQIKGVLSVTQLPSLPASKILGTLDVSQLPKNGYEGTYVKLNGDTMTGRLKLPILQVTGRSDFGEDVFIAGSLTVGQSFNVTEGFGVGGARPDASRNESMAVGGGARFLGFVDVTQQLRVRGTVTLDSNLIIGANQTINGNIDTRGNGTVRGDLTVNGDVTASAFHGVCKEEADKSGTGCKDIAELFEATEPIQPGYLVTLDLTQSEKIRLTAKPYEPHLFGVSVAQPGIVLSSEGVSLGAEAARASSVTQPAIALVGRVRVRFSLDNGSIQIGDALTSSSKRGLAMKATHAGRIIGYALETPAKQSETVLILLNPSFFIPESMLQELNSTRR